MTSSEKWHFRAQHLKEHGVPGWASLTGVFSADSGVSGVAAEIIPATLLAIRNKYCTYAIVFLSALWDGRSPLKQGD
jgi:hypothetical protein